MRQSQLFGRTLKETPKDAQLISHKLLYQGGFIRESAAGRYYFLPLGWKVHQKIQAVIKEEMDNAGAQELLTPVLHPLGLWKETQRNNSVGFELMKVKDRTEAEFVLGGTAEEMIVDLVRRFQISYKDLPFNLYQFSSKFRDELRARGGLLRLREFIMKDAYSFHENEEDFKREYAKMRDTYTRIFERLGLKTVIVESDNGYIGGEYCHEFIVEHEAGESHLLITEDGAYAAHEDVARFRRDEKNLHEAERPMTEVAAQRGNTMEDGARFHNLPLWQQIKNVMMADEKGNLVLAILRGDLEVNETKLAHCIGAHSLRPAREEEIRAVESEPGFISPIGISKKVKVVGDISLRTVKNGYTGANKKFRDFTNVNIDRDYRPDIEADIACAKEEHHSESGVALVAKRGIEVGNIFQLGLHYSSRMAGATFKDRHGKDVPYYMGCYGIGLARTMAAVAEMHQDAEGLLWPDDIAPFRVHLIALKGDEVSRYAQELYSVLLAKGVEVLYDDRGDKSAGEKFADADLIGIPWRVVVSEKTIEKNGVEIKRRSEKNGSIVLQEDLIKSVLA